MTINKNKLKLIPIFNKSLKEIYTNKEYDMIHLYSLLKEDTEFEVPKEGNNIEQSVGTNYFYLKHEKDPSYIHIFQGSLDDENNIIDPKYIYSFNQKLFTDLDANIKILTNADSISKLNKTSDNDVIKKLLLESIVFLINENFNKGLLNNKTSFLNIIEDVLQNINEQFNIFKEIIINENNIVKFDQTDNTYRTVEIKYEELNDKFTGEIGINYFILKKVNTRINIYLDEADIKKFFIGCINKFLDLGEDIKIVEENQNITFIKIKKIASYYTDSFDEVLFNILKANEENLKNDFRRTPSNINDALNILNNDKNSFSFTKNLLGKGGGQGSVKGKGELSVHLMLNTTNACTAIEPDAIIKTSDGEIKCSVKQFSRGDATMQTGSTMQPNIKSAYDAFIKSLNIKSLDYNQLFNALFNILKTNQETREIDVNNFKRIFNISSLNIIEFNSEFIFNKDEIKNKYKNLKKEIASEYGAQYIIYLTTKNDNYIFDYIDCSDINNVADNLQIAVLESARFKFRIRNLKCVTDNLNEIDLNYLLYNFNRVNKYGSIETILGYILLALNNNEAFIEKINKQQSEAEKKAADRREQKRVGRNATKGVNNSGYEQTENSGYKRKGITLKEVFKNLY